MEYLVDVECYENIEMLVDKCKEKDKLIYRLINSFSFLKRTENYNLI